MHGCCEVDGKESVGGARCMTSNFGVEPTLASYSRLAASRRLSLGSGGLSQAQMSPSKMSFCSSSMLPEDFGLAFVQLNRCYVLGRARSL